MIDYQIVTSFSSIKKIKKCITVSIFFLFLCAAKSQTSGVRPFAHLDSNNIFIGDKISLHVGVNHNDKERIIAVSPNNPLDSTKFDIASDTDWRAERIGTYRDIAFTVWDTGLYRIPSLTFTVEFANGEKENFKTSPLLLTVDNPPGIEKMVAPEVIKPIIREPANFSDWLPWILAIVIITVFGIALWFFYKKMREKPAFKDSLPKRKIEPPHIVALQQLTALKKADLIVKGDVKNYYSELSHILREYIENALSLPALESTTDELKAMLLEKNIDSLPQKERDICIQKTNNFLLTADLVKFAKVKPDEESHDIFWQDVFDFIQVTKPQDNIMENKKTS